MTLTGHSGHSGSSSSISTADAILVLQELAPALTAQEIKDIYILECDTNMNKARTYFKEMAQGDIMCKMVNRIGGYLQIYQEFSMVSSSSSTNNVFSNAESVARMEQINLLKMMNDFATLINCEERKKQKCFVCRKHHTLEKIYNFIVRKYLNEVPCDLQNCSALKRNTRNRMDTSSRDQYNKKLISKIQILDSIHTSILHAFDTGYMITSEELTNLSVDIEDDSDAEDVVVVDRRANDIRTLLDTRNDTFSSLRDDIGSGNSSSGSSHRNHNNNNSDSINNGAGGHSKFVTYFGGDNSNSNSNRNTNTNTNANTNTNSHTNTNTSSFDTDSKQSDDDETENETDTRLTNGASGDAPPVYSDGFMYFYPKAAEACTRHHTVINDDAKICDFYVAPRAENLKDEMLNNAVARITFEAWHDENAKADMFKATEYVRKKGESLCSIAFYSFDFTGLIDNDFAEMRQPHILSVLLYTNFTEVSYQFSKTFRRLQASETTPQMLARHRHYREWGVLLQQAIMLFSTSFKGAPFKIWYHGVSCEILFEGAYCRFNCPASTSTNLYVAINFAKNGIILELFNDEYRNERYFDCKFFSDYKNEDECLFFNTFLQIQFKSIRHLGLRENYEPYIKILGIFSSCFNAGLNPFKINKKARNVISLLVNQGLGEEALPVAPKYKAVVVPPYITRLFSHGCSHMKFIAFDAYKMNSAADFGGLRRLFCVEKEESSPDNYGYTNKIKEWRFDLLKKLFHGLTNLILFQHCPLDETFMDAVYAQFIHLKHTNTVGPPIANLTHIEWYNCDYPFGTENTLSAEQAIAAYAAKFKKHGWTLSASCENPFNVRGLTLAAVKVDETETAQY